MGVEPFESVMDPHWDLPNGHGDPAVRRRCDPLDAKHELINDSFANVDMEE